LKKKRTIKKAVLGFSTNNLEIFTNFMVEQLGFELVKYQPDADIAYILDLEGDLVLLAGPSIENVGDYLEYPDFAMKLGATMRFGIDDIEAQRKKLIERGMPNVTIKKGFAERVIHLKGPDDYTIEFPVETEDGLEDVIVLNEGDGGILVAWNTDFDKDTEEDE